MRVALSVVSVLIAVFCSSSFAARTQTALPLPGCEAPPEVRKVLDSDLSMNTLQDRMKFPEQMVYLRTTLDHLIAKYPREYEPYGTLASRMRQFAPEQYPAIRDQQIEMAKDNPNDPLALLLASDRLMGTDTPQAFRLLQAARTKAPDFPWPALRLAAFYTSGKLADPEKVKQNLNLFFGRCPTSTDGYAQMLLPKDPALQSRVTIAIATSMRARLEKETDPQKLREYSTLWRYEFRAHPPSEHDAVRAQLTLDLKRVEALNPKGDAAWQSFLIGGYKQSGASKIVLTPMEDHLIAEYPHSDQAYGIVNDRWYAAHQEPSNAGDLAAWAKRQKAGDEAVRGWVRDYPNDKSLQRYTLLNQYQTDDWLSEKDGIAAVDAFLQASDDYRGPYWKWASYPQAVQLLLDHGWEPARALDLMKQAKANTEDGRLNYPIGDSLTGEELANARKWKTQQDLGYNLQILKAAMLANLPDEALKLKASIETPPPTDRQELSNYWLGRARFDAVQGHKQDAIAFYQLALQTRTYTPKAYQGRVRDELTTEAQTLWKAQGGTEAAWLVWSKPVASSVVADSKDKAAEGGWEKPTRVIPAFELQDMSGKTWRMKDLEGKTIFINVWATWCGPCQEELPLLQKLYEKTKDRTDIQILTFNIDENVGIVAPFLKEKGFTFPVLSAYSMDVLQYGGIPQNWIVDQHGITRWWHMGFGSGTYDDFEKDSLEQLGYAKAPQ